MENFKPLQPQHYLTSYNFIHVHAILVHLQICSIICEVYIVHLDPFTFFQENEICPKLMYFFLTNIIIDTPHVQPHAILLTHQPQKFKCPHVDVKRNSNAL